MGGGNDRGSHAANSRVSDHSPGLRLHDRINESILNDGAIVLMGGFLILLGGAISRASPEMRSRWSITVIVMSVIGWLALVHVGVQFGMSIGFIGLSIGPLLAPVGGIQELVQSNRRKT